MINSRAKGIIGSIIPFVSSEIVNFSADMAVRIWWWTSCQSHASIICQSKSTIMITCRWSDLGEVFTIKTKWNVFQCISSRYMNKNFRFRITYVTVKLTYDMYLGHFHWSTSKLFLPVHEKCYRIPIQNQMVNQIVSPFRNQQFCLPFVKLFVNIWINIWINDIFYNHLSVENFPVTTKIPKLSLECQSTSFMSCNAISIFEIQIIIDSSWNISNGKTIWFISLLPSKLTVKGLLLGSKVLKTNTLFAGAFKCVVEAFEFVTVLLTWHVTWSSIGEIIKNSKNLIFWSHNNLNFQRESFL